MNRKMRIFRICVSCLLAIYIIFNYNELVYAQEEASKSVTFNSVVEIQSYELEEGYLEPGKDANIELVLHNANSHSTANNIIISFTSNSGMIFPSYGNDNQFFVGSLEADSTATVTIPLAVSSKLSGDYVDFNCTIIYETEGRIFTNPSSMILPTQNNITVLVNSVDVSAHTTVNGKSLLSIRYVNNGTDNIEDASISIIGNVSTATNEIKLDSIAAGKSYTKDFNIIFTEPGDQTISLLLSYTDIDGQYVETDLGTYKVNVGDESGSAVLTFKGSRTYRWGGRIISLLALGVVAISSFLYMKKR